MRLLAIGAVFAFVALATYAGLAEFQQRVARRASLRLLAAYGDDPGEGGELDPFQTRALTPAIAWASRVVSRVSPTGYVDRTRHKLLLAGYPQRESVDRFLAMRLGLLVLGFPLGLLMVAALGLEGLLAVAVLGLFTMASVLGPDASLERRIQDRQRAVRAALPDFLDLLTISVEAGLGFEQALNRIAGEMEGVLAEEFQRVLGETRAGSSRAVAMRAMADRLDVPELRSFVLAVLQADVFGISIGDVLRAQSADMRIKWRQLAQERAQKAPVKMLVPMVFCIFPALFVVIIGPALVKIAAAGV